METAVAGIVVFGFAFHTHWEGAHGGCGTVIGEVANNSKAWAAVDAIEKRISKAPVVDVVQLVQTILAGRNIWGHRRATEIARFAAWKNHKFASANAFDAAGNEAVYDSQGRRPV